MIHLPVCHMTVLTISEWTALPIKNVETQIRYCFLLNKAILCLYHNSFSIPGYELSQFGNQMEKNLTKEAELRDGYDLPVYGLDNGLFYALHIPAISCILISLSCAFTAIVLSFRRQAHRSFFSWTKCDRFVVYLALCDGLFNTVHICDHLQMTFSKTHVYPKELCEAYGFFIIVFISSQNLMVNIIAVNIFMIMYFNKQLKFGKRDWKLLLWTFGVPFSGAVIAANLGQFGTTGAL